MERVRVISSGYYLPPRILTNKDLEKTVETSDGWITTRTGIKERHIASSEQATSDLGIEAGRMALNKAGLAPEKIGALICATITPDYAFPSTACMIQKGLGLNQAFALDISAACSGFLYAVTLAESLLLQNRAEYVMVVAAEKLSSFTDWTDRNTCVLFGDGAGAVILKKEKGNRGILSSYLGSDGSYADLLIIPGGGSRKPFSQEVLDKREAFIKMEGNEVFKVAVQKMLESAVKTCERAQIKPEELKLFIPHQANLRIINAVAKRLRLREEQVFINLDRIGNISAATIPVALAEADEKGLLRSGDLLAMVAFGGGFTWAGMSLRW